MCFLVKPDRIHSWHLFALLHYHITCMAHGTRHSGSGSRKSITLGSHFQTYLRGTWTAIDRTNGTEIRENRWKTQTTVTMLARRFRWTTFLFYLWNKTGAMRKICTVFTSASEWKGTINFNDLITRIGSILRQKNVLPVSSCSLFQFHFEVYKSKLKSPMHNSIMPREDGCEEILNIFINSKHKQNMST